MDQQVSQYLRRNSPDGQQLFVLWGGANDFWGGQQDTAAPVLELRNHIVRLAEEGADSFLVANMGSRFGEFSLPQAEEFNLLLSSELSTLRRELPATTIFEFDYYSFFQAIEEGPQGFGFSNISGKACLDCGFGLIEGSIVVPNAEEYYFFDQANPSAAAHRQIGDAAYAVVVPEPCGPLSVLLGALGVIATLRATHSRKTRAKGQR
jgi:phospholipase/lecithinase/hemolysin